MRVIAFDCETHPIQPGMLIPKAVCMSFAERLSPDDHIQTGIYLFPEALHFFEGWLDDPEVVLVAHNGAYDLAVLAAECPRLLRKIFDALEEGRILDTMVRGKLIMIARGEHKFMQRDDGKRVKTNFSLEAMAKLYLGKVLKKEDTWRTKYHLLDGVPLEEWPDDAVEYPLEDAKTCLEVKEAQDKYVNSSMLFRHSRKLLGDLAACIPNEIQQTKAAWVLHLMSVWGISTDGERVEALKEKLTAQLAGSHEFMLAAGLIHQTGSKKNPKWSKDTKKIKALIREGFEKQGKRIPLTDTGDVSTSAEAKIASGVPDLVKMASFATAETLLDSFVPLLERGVKHPICARFNVLVESGRVSCSDPNLLNPPAGDEGVRECYTARAGYAFVDSDFRVIELRVLGQICWDKFGFSRLREVFLAGGDPHDELGARLMGISVEEAATHKIRVPTGAVNLDGSPEMMEITLRAYCKLINFGLASGMGAESFVDYAKQFGVRLTLSQAESIRDSWFATWPEVKKYFQWIGSLIPSGKGVIIQHRSGRVRGGVHFTSAVNTMFQGLTADGAKEGLWLIARECFLEPSSPLFGSRPVIHMYDENMIETPLAKVTEAAKRMGELMVEGMSRIVPDVPIAVSAPVAMKHWSKKAKSLFVNGQLVVCE